MAVRIAWAALLLGLLAAPASAPACGACADHQTRILLPTAGRLVLLPFIWMLAAALVRRTQCGAVPAERRPSRRAIWLTLVWMLGGGFASALTVGGVLTALLFTTVAWCIYPLRSLLLGARGLPRSARILQGATLVAALTVVAHGTLVPVSTASLIRLAGYPTEAVYEIVLPEIIARGPAAVPELIEVAPRGAAYPAVSTAAVFCLGRICSPRARDFLAEQVRGPVRPGSFGWERQVAWAHARCAGPAAVEDLVGLYERAPESERWTVLAALARTGDAAGVRFALERMDVLLESSRHDTVRALAGALLDGSDLADLRDLPLTRERMYVAFEPSSADDLRSEFYWTPASSRALPTAEELRARWQAEGPAIRARWN